MPIERRKTPRFSVRDNAFAVFNSEPVKMIPMVDISLGGLRIAVNGIDISADGLYDATRLEILTDDCRFFMDHLLYQLLPAYRSLPRNAGGLSQHIYGLKFVDLMSGQLSQLKYFIRNHTKGGMTPKFMHKFNHYLHQFIGKKDSGDTCRNLWLQRPSL